MDRLTGKVLITGGTGSLGRATLFMAERNNWNAEFIIFSRDESKQSNLRKQFPKLKYFLGDVAKYSDISNVVRGVRPDIILHYAAYKQIPSSMCNVNATIETNVTGSQNVANAALEYKVKQVVASSTDKACDCGANSYGVSKSLMEHIFQDSNKWETVSFHLARYGNVVASTGSVFPYFRELIKSGGPITVTDKRMTRFWISLETAVGLILKALQQEPGVIVVPRAPAMSVWKLAEYMREEYGSPKIAIEDIGIRAGEKIHESMVSETESFHTHESPLGEHFFIYPPNSGFKTWVPPFSYSSDEPNHWLTWGEMKNLIEESKELGS